MSRSSFVLTCSVLAVTLVCVPGVAADPGVLTVDYDGQVKPIFKSRCFACHGALKHEAGLRLDAGSLILAGGDSGPAVQPGKSAASLLIDRVSAADPDERMPPEGKPLTAEQIALLRAWIEQGARAPQAEKPEHDPRSHWAFQIPVRPSIPLVKDVSWSLNPIDAFIAAEREQRGLTPISVASDHVWLRRVYLDLVGLPPTRTELHAFLGDRSALRYPQVVDRLLSSPQHGERWGRHWMDVWRYSDWYGRRDRQDVRNSFPHIWRWRDWIVRSLNDDKGYDRMVREMLAADEIGPSDDENVVATGYLIRSFYRLNYHTWMRDLVEHTGKAFLGLTLNCAMCHDHKFDPITQQEYFQFRAFFEPLDVRQDRVPGLPDPGPYEKPVYGQSLKPSATGLVRAFDKHLDAETYMFVLGDERNRFPNKPPVQPNLPAALLDKPLAIRPIELPAPAWYPGLKNWVQAEELAKRRDELRSAEDGLAAARREGGRQHQVAETKLAMKKAHLAFAQLRSAADNARYRGTPGEPGKLAQAAGKAERQAQLRETEYELAMARAALAQAHSKAASDEEQRKQIAAAEKLVAAKERSRTKAEKQQAEVRADYSPLSALYPRQSSGRRRALARWIADDKNPLTARVAINHIWLRHFGSPLVSTVFDFGRNGKPPTHPKLLDWLAVELIESGWSMKRIHRLIVTSKTYRLRSTTGVTRPDLAQTVDGALSNNRQKDPENTYLWRMNAGRMEAEVVRDSILHVSGRLENTMGGEDLDFAQGDVIARRSMYFSHHDEGRMTLLKLFDAADPGDCYRRTETLVPQQALALANSRLVRTHSRLLAQRLSNQHQRDETFIEAAFEQLLVRTPSNHELVICQEFLAEQIGLYESDLFSAAESGDDVKPASDSAERARQSLVHALMNHNDFVTIR